MEQVLEAIGNAGRHATEAAPSALHQIWAGLLCLWFWFRALADARLRGGSLTDLLPREPRAPCAIGAEWADGAQSTPLFCWHGALRAVRARSAQVAALATQPGAAGCGCGGAKAGGSGPRVGPCGGLRGPSRGAPRCTSHAPGSLAAVHALSGSGDRGSASRSIFSSVLVAGQAREGHKQHAALHGAELPSHGCYRGVRRDVLSACDVLGSPVAWWPGAGTEPNGGAGHRPLQRRPSRTSLQCHAACRSLRGAIWGPCCRCGAAGGGPKSGHLAAHHPLCGRIRAAGIGSYPEGPRIQPLPAHVR
mmetsp:Transcript_74474/g.205512  ORF Transcript_74474/g.205512 Transcript_74474/m.205512 type:complete len:305 (-) Transcript_74474:604-1518(-)